MSDFSGVTHKPFSLTVYGCDDGATQITAELRCVVNGTEQSPIAVASSGDIVVNPIPASE